MNPHNQQLFVLIVHFGAPAVTARAVESLLRGTKQATKILIIDHGDHPLTLPPNDHVQIIKPSSAGGYAAGINFGLGLLLHQGIQAEDIVIAMNNDVEVYPDTLAQLAAWWSMATKPGLVGGSVEERGVIVRGGGSIHFRSGQARLHETADHPLHYIHGAFIAAPYEVWLRLQGLPGHYYLYWEDVLLGQRAQELGFTLQYAPLVRLKHDTDRTMSVQQQYYLIRNGALFMQQEFPAPGRWWWRLYNHLRYLYHALHPESSHHRLVARALKDALKGKADKVEMM